MLIHSFALNDIDLNNVIKIGMVFIDKHVKCHIIIRRLTALVKLQLVQAIYGLTRNKLQQF